MCGPSYFSCIFESLAVYLRQSCEANRTICYANERVATVAPYRRAEIRSLSMATHCVARLRGHLTLVKKPEANAAGRGWVGDILWGKEEQVRFVCSTMDVQRYCCAFV